MQATKDMVVGIHYDLSSDGEAVESSRKDEPVYVLLGRGQWIPALEAAVEGHVAGDSFQVELAPDQAYGERRDDAIQRMSKKYFRDAARLKPGMTTVLSLREGGQRAVTVRKVGMTTIDVDTNHPMAGKTLHFDIELVDVRQATPAELEHGHAHAPGDPAH